LNDFYDIPYNKFVRYAYFAFSGRLVNITLVEGKRMALTGRRSQ
jgi:hypothetical protein